MCHRCHPILIAHSRPFPFSAVRCIRHSSVRLGFSLYSRYCRWFVYFTWKFNAFVQCWRTSRENPVAAQQSANSRAMHARELNANVSSLWSVYTRQYHWMYLQWVSSKIDNHNIRTHSHDNLLICWNEKRNPLAANYSVINCHTLITLLQGIHKWNCVICGFDCHRPVHWQRIRALQYSRIKILRANFKRDFLNSSGVKMQLRHQISKLRVRRHSFHWHHLHNMLL